MAEGGSVQDRLSGCARDLAETRARHSTLKRSERALRHRSVSHVTHIMILRELTPRLVS
jgi:hypothetical protein